jgi:hypothetical protein
LTELPAGLPKSLFEAGDIGACLGGQLALFDLAAHIHRQQPANSSVSPRMPMKPECISAASERACARAARGLGQIGMRGCSSATYSIIASESHTTISPSCNEDICRPEKSVTFPRGNFLAKDPQNAHDNGQGYRLGNEPEDL